MATPTGLRQSSRDLGFPPTEQGQAQEGMPELPPGFTYTQLESMIRELRTAAALEVLTSSLCLQKLCQVCSDHPCLVSWLLVCQSVCAGVDDF